MKISVEFPNDREMFAFLEEMEARYRLDIDVRVELNPSFDPYGPCETCDRGIWL